MLWERNQGDIRHTNGILISKSTSVKLIHMKIFLLAGFLLGSLCHRLTVAGACTLMQVTNDPWVTCCSSTCPIATAQHGRYYPAMVHCPRGKLKVWGRQNKNFLQALSRNIKLSDLNLFNISSTEKYYFPFIIFTFTYSMWQTSF